MSYEKCFQVILTTFFVVDMRRPKRVGQVSQGDEQLPKDGGDLPVEPQVRQLQSTSGRDGTTQSQNCGAGSGLGTTQVSCFYSRNIPNEIPHSNDICASLFS
jgi:hypothetical protein